MQVEVSSGMFSKWIGLTSLAATPLLAADLPVRKLKIRHMGIT